MPEAVKEVVSEAPQDILTDDASDKISCKEVKSVNTPDSSIAEGFEEKDKAMENKSDNKSEELKQEDTHEQPEKKEETEENGTSGKIEQTVLEVTEDKVEQNKMEVSTQENTPGESEKKEEVGENGTTGNKEAGATEEAKDQESNTKGPNLSVENSEVDNSNKSEKEFDDLNQESKDSSLKVDQQILNETTEKPLQAKVVSEDVKRDNSEGNNDSMEICQISDDKISSINEVSGNKVKCTEETTSQKDVQSVNSETIAEEKSEGMEVDNIPSEPALDESSKAAATNLNNAVEEVSCTNKDNDVETEVNNGQDEVAAPVSSPKQHKGTDDVKDEQMVVDKSENVSKKSDKNDVTTCSAVLVDEKITENKRSAESANMEIANEGSWKESETDDIGKPEETKISSSGAAPEVKDSGKSIQEIPQCTPNVLAEKEIESKAETKDISDGDKSITSTEIETASTKLDNTLPPNVKEIESPVVEATDIKNEVLLPANEEKILHSNTVSISKITESDITDKGAGSDKTGDGKLEKKETDCNLEPLGGNVNSSQEDDKVTCKEGGDKDTEQSKPTLSSESNFEVDKSVSVKQNEQEEPISCSGNVTVEAGNSTEIDPTKAEEVRTLVNDARAALSENDYFTAADLFGKACEISGKLYGDLGHENAELYYSYGCAMLECAKNENTVLGESVKGKESEEDKIDEDEEMEESNEDVNGDEEMEVDETEEAAEVLNEEESKNEAKENMENSTVGDGNSEGESTKEEEEDTNLKVAWEMFELAKVIFTKTGNDLRLADTYIKLGEVGMESGHKDAIEDMKNAINLRMKCVPDNDRLLAETHFNIALAYGMFQQFDNAIEALQLSKSILECRIEKLKKNESDNAKLEMKEIGDLLPDLDEKIQDMRDSKEAKEKSVLNGEKMSVETVAEGSSKSTVSNISHLVKRKRKLEDVTSDLLPSSKHPCTENVSEITSTEKPEN